MGNPVTCLGPVLDSMAFEEDKQAAKDTLLAPTDKRVDMYRNCLIELKAALTNEQWNPNPYEIRLTVPAPGELDFLEEREAFRRARFEGRRRGCGRRRP